MNDSKDLERALRENHQRKELLLKVREQSQELKKKNTEMEELIYTISHDLKSPLISIQGFLSILQEDFEEQFPDDAQFYLERISKNIEIMERLIREILDYSRIGRILEEKEVFNVKQVIDDAVIQYSAQIAEININIAFCSPFPDIFAERNRIKQIFSNLIENSVKFTGKKDSPIIEIGTKEYGSEFVTIYVKDNGIGIPNEFKERIFNIFTRASNARKMNVEGTGIGLAHVKKIVETHGGTIWAESEKGKGTTMFFKLPCDPKKQ